MESLWWDGFGLLGRCFLAFVVLYMVGVACWLQIRMDALVYAFYNKDKKWKSTEAPHSANPVGHYSSACDAYLLTPYCAPVRQTFKLEGIVY